MVRRELGNNANFLFFKSPQLGRLAGGGVRTRNGFVTTSLCSPSRATLLSGLHAHEHGITFNVVAVRTETRKQVENHGNPEWAQLFDLTVDPGAVTVLAGIEGELARLKWYSGYQLFRRFRGF